MTELIKYEEARQALKICATVDEAKDILDKTEALRAYARQQKDTDMEVWLAEVKLRARRRIGEISKELETAGNEFALPSTGKTKTETLAQAGLSTSAANRCEKIADIPEDKFEKVIQEAKEEQRPVTFADVEKQVKYNHGVNNQTSSGEEEWYTPDSVLEKVFRVMGDVDLDPCSDPQGNVSAAVRYTKEDDGLSKVWEGRVFMNPPYGNPTTKNWCEYMTQQPVDQAMVLVRSSTGADYFHELMEWADAMCLYRGRLEFKAGSNQNSSMSTFYNVMFYKGHCLREFQKEFSEDGRVILL